MICHGITSGVKKLLGCFREGVGGGGGGVWGGGDDINLRYGKVRID
jgi:hypothetical protein